MPVPLILVDGESLQETLFWLSQPGIHESLGEAEADIGAALVRCLLAWPMYVPRIGHRSDVYRTR